MKTKSQYKKPSSKALWQAFGPESRALIGIPTKQAWTSSLGLFIRKYSSSKERELGVMTRETKNNKILVIQGGAKSQAGSHKMVCFVPTQAVQIKGLLIQSLAWSIQEIFGQDFRASQADLRGLVDLWQGLYGALSNEQARGLIKCIMVKDSKGNLGLLSTKILLNQEGLWRVVLTKSEGCLTSREICLEVNDEVAYPFAWIHEPVAGWLAGRTGVAGAGIRN
jgi:hypothetical protein